MNTYFLPFIALLFISLISCADPTNKEKVETASVKQEVPAGSVKAYFAGGCFWCTEAVYERLKGVSSVVSGYTGGKEKNPTYQQVSQGMTGHAEAVEVTYDPKQMTYEQLLEVFYVAAHDPTQLNRQGPDVGEHYRSAIFYRNEAEKKAAESVKARLENEGKVRGTIVTQIVPLTKFWPAEEYHQDYYDDNTDNPYIRSVAKPKVDKVEKEYEGWLK